MVAIILALFSMDVYAWSYPKDFYSEVDRLGQNTEQVKKYIQKVTTENQNKNQGYRQARRFLFGTLHLEQKEKGQYAIKDVYCHKSFGPEHGVGPRQIPNHEHINAEHTWPQKHFTHRAPKRMQKSDLHHLFPTDSRANSMRGHFAFGESNYSQKLFAGCEESRRAKHKAEYLFEPPTVHKGNVARALFYFSMRYNAKISKWEESTLRRWHEMDPVDHEERMRNRAIEKFQGNPNPFIDYPELVDLIHNF